MKRIPLISLALLVVLLSLIGCKDSPNNNPGDQGNGNETVIHDAYSKGLSSPFIDGKDTTGITLKVTLDNDNKFKNVSVGEDVTPWFENPLYDLTAKITEVNSGVTSKSTENDITSITIGFSGIPKSAPKKISITIPAEKLVERDMPLGVVIEGQKYTINFMIFGEDGSKYIKQEVQAGKKATRPNTIKEGYIVDEWKYYDSFKNEYIFDFDSIITRDISPQGSGKSIRVVTFEYYEGKTTGEVVVAKGEKVSAPIDTGRNGYNFGGWYLDESEFDFSTPITENITLKGKWYDANSRVLVNWYAGNKKITSTSVSQGSLITPIQEPNNVYKESVADKFKHWTTDLTTKTPFDFSSTKALADIDLYVVWDELNVGDTFVLEDEYIGKNDELKKKGIELVILGKRGVSSYGTGVRGLPSNYPYKYIAVDKNHDLSYYILGSDLYNVYEPSESNFTEWANTNYQTGGNGDNIGDGFSNTQKALACGQNLFKRDSDLANNQTIWNWFVFFTENNITSENRDKWFVPSIEEVIQIVRFENDKYGPEINNLTDTSDCNPCYWSSTETNRPINVANSPGAPEESAKYVKYFQLGGHFRMTVFTSLKSPTTHGYYYRTRLCRVL